MSETDLASSGIGELYAMFWRLVHLSVHRYGSHPTGELLIVLTIMLLDKTGHYPTVSELAEITGLPKSSVSRYVSSEISDGYLEEDIDPKDRRRRYLKPTALAREEQAWHEEQLRGVGEMSRHILSNLENTDDPGLALRNILLKITQQNT